MARIAIYTAKADRASIAAGSSSVGAGWNNICFLHTLNATTQAWDKRTIFFISTILPATQNKTDVNL
jgi:hypothetical protein